MALKIIVGSLFDITDPTGRLLELYNSGAFIKYVWDGTKWKSYNPGIISFDYTGRKINIVQETGAGKTVLLAIFANRARLRGREIAGNLKFAWTTNNIGKDKSEWRPAIRGIQDIEKANNIDLEIDDIYGTITSWNCKEADFIRTAALIARKSFVNMNFTAQFTTNQIPPDLRRITGEYHVPFIRCVDATRKSPDGHNFPLELIDLRFNGFFQYKGYKVYNLQSETGITVLNGYDTLEISTSLKADGENESCNKPGWELECEAEKYLQSLCPNVEIKHPHNKTFDLYTPTHMFDVIDTDEDGHGWCKHKTWAQHIGAARRNNKIPYLMFKWGETWGVIRIKPDLPEGQRINFADSSIYNRIRTLEGILTPHPVSIPQTISSV